MPGSGGGGELGGESGIRAKGIGSLQQHLLYVGAGPFDALRLAQGRPIRRSPCLELVEKVRLACIELVETLIAGASNLRFCRDVQYHNSSVGAAYL